MQHKYGLWLWRGWCLGTCHPRRFILLLRLVCWTMALAGLTKIWALPQVLRWMSSAQQLPARSIPPHEFVALVDRLLSLNCWVFTPTCWKRAILLHRGLAQQGIATQIVFGVRKDEVGLLAGHAWLEADGQAVYESTPPDYVRTLVFP